MAAARRPGAHPRGGERAVLRRARSRSTTRSATFLGLPTTWATRRSSGTTPGPGSADMDPRHAPRADRPLRRRTTSALADWLGRMPIWRRMTVHRRTAPRGAAETRRDARTRRRSARGGLANMAGAGAGRRRRASSSPGWSRGRSAPSRPARSSPPPPRSCWPAALAKLGTQTGLVYWPARLRATGQAHLLGACLRTGLTPVARARRCCWPSRCGSPRRRSPGSPRGRRARGRRAHRRAAGAGRLPAAAGAHRRAAHRHPRLPGDAADRAARPDRCAARCSCCWSARSGSAALWTAAAAAARSRWPGRCRTCRCGARRRTRCAGRYRRPRRPPARGPGARERRGAAPATSGGSPARARVASVAQLALQRVDVLLVAALGGLARGRDLRGRRPVRRARSSSPTRASRSRCSRGWPRRWPPATGPPPTTSTRPPPAGWCW